MVQRKLVLVAGLGIVSLVAGCKTDGLSTEPGASFSGIPVISHVNPSALSAAFVTDWSPFEAAANALRTSDSRYTVQKQDNWYFTSDHVLHNSYSLAHARVEYAHAAGLTGAGQIISIIDAGFLQSHAEFQGKPTPLTPGGAYDPGVDSHGTAVASIAAGSASSGQMIGVAPGARLQLGDFSSQWAMAAATVQAKNVGAIVQNNSWGYEIDATQANYNNVFSGSDGQAYRDALRGFAQGGVVVFAASNDTTRTSSDIMAALPKLDPSLEKSWITVVDAVPNTNADGNIVSASLISSQCFEAAAWCIAADGYIYGANASGNNSYSYVVGTSFAAPQVSGAIALLAEAFPSLSAQELRARLLASANNSFFNHTNYVEFAPGVKHGFSTKFGHGFLDMKAALSPIGGSFIARAAGGAVRVDHPILASGGLAGDALTRRLDKFDIDVVDGLGADFRRPASMLSAQGKVQHDPQAALLGLFATDLASPQADPFHDAQPFGATAAGQQFDFNAPDLQFSLLVPENNAQTGNFGLAVSHDLTPGGALRLGLSALHEGGSFAGLRSRIPGESLSGTHAAATLEMAMPAGRNASFGLRGSLGIALPQGGTSELELSPVTYNSLSISYGARDVLGTGDRLTLAATLPQAIQSGTARMRLPVSRSGGTPVFADLNIPLAATGRQVDLSLSYGTSLAEGTDLLFSATRRINDGNIAGNNTAEATIGLRIAF